MISQLTILKDHFNNGGTIIYDGKRIVEANLNQSSNGFVFVRLEGETKHFEVSIFNLIII